LHLAYVHYIAVELIFIGVLACGFSYTQVYAYKRSFLLQSVLVT
jgi:hypothetical protein